MSVNRRSFIKKMGVGAAGLAVGPPAINAAEKSISTNSISTKSYNRIIGANERIHGAIMGLGWGLCGFIEPIANKSSNVELRYLCDVNDKQMNNAMNNF